MSKKILIIEDETALLYALQTQLSVAGFNVVAADNGKSAIKLLKEEKPDAVVLDIVLPQMNGWEILEKMKQDPHTQDIPAIIISNLSDESSQKRGIKLGAKDYLAKVNYSVEELVNKIKEII